MEPFSLGLALIAGVGALIADVLGSERDTKPRRKRSKSSSREENNQDHDTNS